MITSGSLARSRRHRTAHLALGDGAGLVQDHGVQPGRRIPTPPRPVIRMPSCAPRPVPTGRAVGVARPRASGTGDDQHRHRSGEGERGPRALAEPEPESADRDRDHHRREDPGDLVGQPLHLGLAGCAGSTRRAIWASWVSAPIREAVTSSRPWVLDAAAEHAVTRSDLGRRGFTGHGRGVHGRVPGDHPTVGGRCAHLGEPRTGHRRAARRSRYGLRTVPEHSHLGGGQGEQGAHAAPDQRLARASR